MQFSSERDGERVRFGGKTVAAQDQPVKKVRVDPDGVAPVGVWVDDGFVVICRVAFCQAAKAVVRAHLSRVEKMLAYYALPFVLRQQAVEQGQEVAPTDDTNRIACIAIAVEEERVFLVPEPFENRRPRCLCTGM